MNQKPIRIFNIKYSEEDRKNIHKYVDRVIDEAFLTNHTLCRELETTINQLQSTNFSISTSSATTGLEVIFRTLKIKNKAVLTQSNTFIATAHAIQAAGGYIVPIDLSSEYVLSYQDLIKAYEECLDKSIEIGAVCIVHISGRASNEIFKIRDFCINQKIPLVEDNAQGFLSSIGERYLGSIGKYSATSFQTTKVVACGEGGIVSCLNQEDAELIKRNILFGKSKSVIGKYDSESGNFKLSEMNAALVLADLKRVRKRIKRRQEIDNMYKSFVSSKFLHYLKAPDENNPSCYKTIFLANSIEIRKDIESYFKENLISMTGSVYRDHLSIQPRVTESKNFLKRFLPLTDQFCSLHFAPPNYPELTDDEIFRVIDTLNSYKN